MSFPNNGTYRRHHCPLGSDCKLRTSTATQPCRTSHHLPNETIRKDTITNVPHNSPSERYSNITKHRFHECPPSWDCKHPASMATPSSSTTTTKDRIFDIFSLLKFKPRSSTSILPYSYKVIEVPTEHPSFSLIILFLEFSFHLQSSSSPLEIRSLTTSPAMYTEVFSGRLAPTASSSRLQTPRGLLLLRGVLERLLILLSRFKNPTYCARRNFLLQGKCTGD